MADAFGPEVHADGTQELYSEWKLRVWQPPGTDNADAATWRLAEA